ncbi:unnamed protein product, partial [Ectocarpus fasciculatus]
VPPPPPVRPAKSWLGFTDDAVAVAGAAKSWLGRNDDVDSGGGGGCCCCCCCCDVCGAEKLGGEDEL